MNEAMARILIIEDDLRARDHLSRVLAREGHQVIVASDGEQGITLYREEPCDLVITDIYMPGKEGLETIMELRREFSGVKIIAVSEDPEDGFDPLFLARKLGAFCTFAKPLVLSEFLVAVRGAMAP